MVATTPSDADFRRWIGRRAVTSDKMDAGRINALRAALGQNDAVAEGDELPILSHWLHFWDIHPPCEAGADGHRANGGFLPPVPLPRRMWAGGRLRFLAPLRIGDAVERTSTILDIVHKDGKSGALVFVTIKHELTGPNGLAVVEEQDLVYRDAATGPAALLEASGEPSSSAFRTRFQPDAVVLFRFSALTMNSHRIHYDLPYAKGEEGYPALVVHGPLQAMLLADLGSRSLGAPICGFTFRGKAPAFADMPLDLCADAADGPGLSLWSEQRANTTMVARIEGAPKAERHQS